MSMDIKKPVVLLVFTLFLTGFYFMMFGWFIVSELIFISLLWSSLFLSLGVTVFWAIAVHKSGYRHASKYGRLDIKNKVWHRVLAVPLAYLGILFFAILIVVYGVPGALHQVFSEAAVYEFVVTDKEDRRKHRRCIDLAGVSILSGRFCYVPRQTWQAVSVNSKVLAYGTESIFGFQVKEFKAANK